MITVSITYPNAEGASFDFDYYKRTHLPMIGRNLGAYGLSSAAVLQGKEAADGGEPPVVAAAFLTFQSEQGARDAMASSGALELVEDVKNFTNIVPVVQYSVPVP